MLFKRILRIFRYILIVLLTLILVISVYFRIAVVIEPPSPENVGVLQTMVEYDTAGFLMCGNGRLQQNSYGLWELYVEGGPFEMGVINGKLTQSLISRQEEAFVNRIYELVPSKSYLNVLKYFIAFFNRHMDKYVPGEYQLEIYGISLSADDEYDFIGSKYQRILNYHGAHDIGHALQNMNLVGCTAFASWDGKSSGGELLVGRNFDFHAGEEFNRDKIIAFVKPENGFRFMFITWGGMIGVVSGMNEKGLTITLNAAKSDIPFSAATPVSILAREILQYAATIEEAFEIAKKRETFVSEAFLVGSGQEDIAGVIEKTPDTTVLYIPDTNYLILTNHFLGDNFATDSLNCENMRNTSTVYRSLRVEELMNGYDSLDVASAVEILRNREGLGNTDIGNGNEKAINQLIAHHSVVFKPAQGKVWVSAGPYQLGEYLCYDLNHVFERFPESTGPIILYEESGNIAKDGFLDSADWKSFQEYRRIIGLVRKSIKDKNDTVFNLSYIVSLNPFFFEAYEVAGDRKNFEGDYQAALKYYRKALECEIPTRYTRNAIEDKITDIQEQIR